MTATRVGVLLGVCSLFVVAAAPLAAQPKAPGCNSKCATLFVDTGNVYTTAGSGSPSPPSTCALGILVGAYAGVLNGTTGDDVIVGSAGADLIWGNGGNDTICSLAGADQVLTEGGTDWVDSAAGNDILCLSNGNNTANSGSEVDKVVTGTGTDSLTGSNGDDIALYSGTGADVLRGGLQNDYLVAGSTSANLGGEGNAGGSPGDTCEYPTGATVAGCETLRPDLITTAFCVAKRVVGAVPAAAWEFSLTCDDGTDEEFTIPAIGGLYVIPTPYLLFADVDCTITETGKPSHEISAIACTRTDRTGGAAATNYDLLAADPSADVFNLDGDTVTCQFTNEEVTDPCDPAPDCSGFDTDCGVASCDPNGSVGNCDTLTPIAADTECRPTAGACDVAETCDGTNTGACPADDVLPFGTVCNVGSGDSCDPSEVCDGSDAACPADTVAPAGTVCNAGSGDLCDPNETCTGVADAACPADIVAPGGTVCNAGSGDLCDPDETCTGVADAACPTDTVAPGGTVCNAGSGDLCDPDETCSGSADAACPADTVAPAGSECRGLAGICDVAEQCTGTAELPCPADGYDTGTECRADDGECDVAESCDGSGVDCPADGFEPVDTPCGDDSDTECTNPDTCAGDSNTCLDNHEADDTPCGSDSDTECDNADSCLAGACEPNYEPVDKPCGDPGDGACTDPDSCDDAGECLQNHEECGLVTGAGACIFDLVPNSSCEPEREFRNIMTPDVQLWPAFKLSGTNPGQFRYNVFVAGEPGETQVVTVALPFPFVTQGANPVHVYDGDLTGNDGACFLPPSAALAAIDATVSMADYINGTIDASRHNLSCDSFDGPLTGPDSGAQCLFDVEFTVPPSGLSYIQVHLDYGLKHPVWADGNPADGASDRYDLGAQDPVYGADALLDTVGGAGELRLANCQEYEFAHDADGTPAGGDVVASVNTFKRIAGVLGLVAKSADGSLIPGVPVQLLRFGKPIATGTTDADGFYYLGYKHKGKAATFTVRILGGYNLTQSIVLKANGWAEVNFDLSTGAATGQFGSGQK